MSSPLLARACAILAEGKVVGVPTDTVYGLATRRSARKQLFQLKGRPSGKAIPVLVGTMADAEGLAVFPPIARRLAQFHWPGPLTLVLAVRPEVGTEARGTIGLRMPNHPLTRKLLTLGVPLAVTSANPSGGAPARSDEEAREMFGDNVELYLPGVCPGGAASTVIEVLTNQNPRVLRAGPVTL